MLSLAQRRCLSLALSLTHRRRRNSATIRNEISGAAFAVLPRRPGGWLSVAECVGYHCCSLASFFVLVGRPALIRTLRQTPAGWGLLRMSGPDRTSFSIREVLPERTSGVAEGGGLDLARIG